MAPPASQISTGPVPLPLIRMRSATRHYVTILRGTYPELTELEAQTRATGAEDDVLHALIACVRITLDDKEHPGGVATIAYLLGLLLGEVGEA